MAIAEGHAPVNSTMSHGGFIFVEKQTSQTWFRDTRLKVRCVPIQRILIYYGIEDARRTLDVN